MTSVSCLVFLLVVSLVESQPSQSSQRVSSPHSAEQSPPSQDNLSFPWSRLRLPRYAAQHGSLIKDNCRVASRIYVFLYLRYIIPLHYHLLLHPNLTTLRFTGTVQIQIDVLNNTNWVVLHSKGLQISNATILDHKLDHLSDQVVVDSADQLVFYCCTKTAISSCSRFSPFFITPPMSRLVYSPPGSSAVGRSISCMLSLKQSLLRGFMDSI